MLRTTLRHVCPCCGLGELFAHGYTLRRECRVCGLDLEGRHGAHYGGPIALGYGIGGVLGLAVFALLSARFGFADWVVWATVAVVVVSIFATFRHCKAWWTWWLYRAGELRGGRPPQERTDRADARAAGPEP